MKNFTKADTECRRMAAMAIGAMLAVIPAYELESLMIDEKDQHASISFNAWSNTGNKPVITVDIDWATKNVLGDEPELIPYLTISAEAPAQQCACIGGQSYEEIKAAADILKEKVGNVIEGLYEKMDGRFMTDIADDDGTVLGYRSFHNDMGGTMCLTHTIFFEGEEEK